VPDPQPAVPSTLIQGDTLAVRWPEPSDTRVADGWTHALRVQGTDGSDATATGTATDGVLTFTLAAAATSGLAVGPATWAWAATKAAERYTLGSGVLAVRADPSGDQSTSELAHVRRVIAACEARLEGKVTDDVLMYQLPDGIMLQKLSLTQVHGLLTQYRAKERRLLSAGRATIRVREAWYAHRY
jgi:hypothetical protein